MNRHPTATVWVFAYGGITGGTHAALVRDCLDWPNLDHWVMDDDAAIYRSRGRVATQFLRTPREKAGDVLLLVDHDIFWQPGDLSMIARRALEREAIVGGIYPKRAFAQGAAHRLDDSGEWRIGEDALINAAYLSAGFTAYPRSVLAALAETLPWIEEGFWPFFLPMVAQTTYLGKTGWEYLTEDWALCHRAREAGFALYASTYPRLTHTGSYTYRLVDAKSRPLPDEDVTITLSSSPVLTGDRSN